MAATGQRRWPSSWRRRIPTFPTSWITWTASVRVPPAYPQAPPTLSIRNRDVPRGFGINIEKGWDRLVAEMRGATLLALTNALDRRLGVVPGRAKGRDGQGDHLQRHETRGRVRDFGSSRFQSAGARAGAEGLCAGGVVQQGAGGRGESATGARDAAAEARLGRDRLYQRSSDGVVYTLPLQPGRRAQLPAGTAGGQIVPADRAVAVPAAGGTDPAQRRRVARRGADRGRPFAEKAAAQQQMSLTSHVNYLAQNLHQLAKQGQRRQQEEEKEKEEAEAAAAAAAVAAEAERGGGVSEGQVGRAWRKEPHQGHTRPPSGHFHEKRDRKHSELESDDDDDDDDASYSSDDSSSDGGAAVEPATATAGSGRASAAAAGPVHGGAQRSTGLLFPGHRVARGGAGGGEGGERARAVRAVQGGQRGGGAAQRRRARGELRQVHGGAGGALPRRADARRLGAGGHAGHGGLRAGRHVVGVAGGHVQPVLVDGHGSGADGGARRRRHQRVPRVPRALLAALPEVRLLATGAGGGGGGTGRGGRRRGARRPRRTRGWACARARRCRGAGRARTTGAASAGSLRLLRARARVRPLPRRAESHAAEVGQPHGVRLVLARAALRPPRPASSAAAPWSGPAARASGRAGAARATAG